MIDRVLGRVFLAALLGLGAAGCVRIPPDPLQLNGGILTVDNRTDDEWTNVEIWVNNYYRATAPSIAGGSRFTVSLGSFVDGYGRRFPRERQMLKALHLTAKTTTGAAVRLDKAFERGGLAALQRKQ